MIGSGIEICIDLSSRFYSSSSVFFSPCRKIVQGICIQYLILVSNRNFLFSRIHFVLSCIVRIVIEKRNTIPFDSIRFDSIGLENYDLENLWEIFIIPIDIVVSNYFSLWLNEESTLQDPYHLIFPSRKILQESAEDSYADNYNRINNFPFSFPARHTNQTTWFRIKKGSSNRPEETILLLHHQLLNPNVQSYITAKKRSQITRSFAWRVRTDRSFLL